MNIQKKQAGFTLVELITVVSLVALLVVYITVELGQSNDDAKVAMATAFILGSVPKAASSYKARHFGSCADIDTTYTGSYADAADTSLNDVKRNLIDRGLYQKTPWDEYWEMSFAQPTRTITLTIPTTASDAPNAAAVDIYNNIKDKPQVDTATDPGPTGTEVVVTFHCS